MAVTNTLEACPLLRIGVRGGVDGNMKSKESAGAFPECAIGTPSGRSGAIALAKAAALEVLNLLVLLVQKVHILKRT
jgi:hypothetical protein